MPTMDEFEMGGSLYKTQHDGKSQRRLREDRSVVDQIWTSESIVANAVAN